MGGSENDRLSKTSVLPSYELKKKKGAKARLDNQGEREKSY